MVTEEEEAWEKCVGQLKLNLNVILAPLRMYGQGHYVDSAREEIVSLAIQLHHKLLGLEEPFHINGDKLHW